MQRPPAARRRVQRRLAIGFGAALALTLIAGVYANSTLAQLPDPGKDTALAGSILVYDRHGHLLAERNRTGSYHIVLKLSQMGRYGPAATLASEDRGFYSQGAIDPFALARAAAVDLLSGQPIEGGSTISQQLVKIQLLGPDKSIGRKVQEAWLASALENKYSKQQILEMYLNRVYYGHGAYGLASATKTYFGSDKSPSDLTPAQAAFLAGLLQAPSGDDPETHYDRARARELYVLNGMVAMGVLSHAQADDAAAEPIRSELRYDTSYRAEPAPHFVDYVLEKLEAQFGAASIQQGGLAVYTTLDGPLQASAEQAVKDGVRSLAGDGVNNGDLLAVDPRTGEILAWVGSADYSSDTIGGQYDVLTSPRQPGSSFKPYVYESALRDHTITLCTSLSDTPTDFNGYRPLDFDDRFMGPISARKALLLSRNIPAVETAQKEGIDKVIALAHSMGVTTPLKSELGTAIGDSDITMYEQVQGYQAFANQGLEMPLMPITKVVDRSGRTVFEQTPGQQPGSKQVISPAEAYLVTDVLKDYANQWGLGWGRRMAGKSGTSGGNSGLHPDAWMMAYNPDIVVGAWASNTGADGAGSPTAAYGVNVGETISAEFINRLPAAMNGWYSQPQDLTRRNGELFLPGTETSKCAQAKKSGPAPGPKVDLHGTLAEDLQLTVDTDGGEMTVTIPQGAKVDGSATQSGGGLVATDFHARGGGGGTALQGTLAADVSVSVETKHGTVEVTLTAGDKVDGSTTDVHVRAQ